MGLMVYRVRRVNSGHVLVKYKVWADSCPACSVKNKALVIATEKDINEQEAENFIRSGLHVRPWRL